MKFLSFKNDLKKVHTDFLCRKFFCGVFFMISAIFSLSAKSYGNTVKSSDGMVTVTPEKDGLHIEKKHASKFVHITIFVKGEDGENLSISTTEKTNSFVYPFVQADKYYEVYLTMMDASWGSWTQSKSARVKAAGGYGDFRCSLTGFSYDNKNTAVVLENYKVTRPADFNLSDIAYSGNIYYDQQPGKADYSKAVWSNYAFEDNKIMLGRKSSYFVNTDFFVQLDAKMFYDGNTYTTTLVYNLKDHFKDVHPVKNVAIDNGLMVPVFSLSVTDYEIKATDRTVTLTPEFSKEVDIKQDSYILEPMDGNKQTISFDYEGQTFAYNFTYVKDPEFTFDGKTYAQTFFDDFEGTDLDTSKWHLANEEERQPSMNNHGWWKNDCCYLDGNGNFVIEAKQVGKLNCSGSIESSGLFEQAHGYYEIKFKCDRTSGMWYAFWLLGQNDNAHVGKGATDAAEIDIFELIPNENDKSSNSFKTTIHWDGYGETHRSKGSPEKHWKRDFYDSWHIAKFVWGDTSYKLWVDDQLLYEMDASKVDLNHFGGMCNGKAYMIISSEFGDWGGSIKKDMLPAKMYVDYVKVGTEIK